jgi:putative membrane protein
VTEHVQRIPVGGWAVYAGSVAKSRPELVDRDRLIVPRTLISEPPILMLLVAIVLVLSAFGPYDRATWVLEVAPVLIGLTVLTGTYLRFPLTRLAYRLLAVHAVILIVGGYYSYARVPLGFALQDMFDLGRNHYDRFAHLVQGFVPAIVVRELLLRTSALTHGVWLRIAVTSMCLAFSALYELIEWFTAVVFGDGAVVFISTQGDPWDAQWDMLLALIGALLAQLTLAGQHDRHLRDLTTRNG